MKLYGVVNIDIVGSRNVQDRNKLQSNICNYINYINEKYISILAAPVTITLGDEWQLITDKPSECYNLVHEFQKLLWKDGMDLYAGIGIGELATPISEDIRKMDGPCFHIARDAINIAKNVDKLKSKYSINKLNKVFLLTHLIPYSSIDFNLLDLFYSSKTSNSEPAMEEVAAASEDSIHDKSKPDFYNKLLFGRTVNLIIENNEILKAKMTDKQRQVYISYSNLKSYRKVIEAIGADTKETVGSISHKLNSASYFTIQRNHYIVSVLLNSYCNTGV